MRRLIVAVVLLLAPLGAPGVALGAPRWHLVAADSFDGSHLDRGRWWVYDGPGNEDIGLRRPSAVSVGGGELRITARGDVSGGIQMKRAFLYGLVSVRLRQDPGVGYGPTVLLWPASGDWPSGGEIDLVEIPDGSRRVAFAAVHYGRADRSVTASATGNFTRWHTWTLLWERNRVIVWLDGKTVLSVTNRAAIPDTPMRVAIQNDVGAAGHFIGGPDATTPADVTLHVEGVRVWQASR